MPNTPVLAKRTIQQLRDQLRGELLRPSDDSYQSARRVWNGMIDRHPALIVQCVTTSDITRAVNFAREHNLPIAIRGGGHNIAGNAVCDDGLVIDLSRMKGLQLDHSRRDGWEALQPFSSGGVYVNYLGPEGHLRVQAAYGPATYDRLVSLKTKYDPDNIFRFNQNISPEIERESAAQ